MQNQLETHDGGGQQIRNRSQGPWGVRSHEQCAAMSGECRARQRQLESGRKMGNIIAERLMILAVHVNDMLLAGNDHELMKEGKAWLAKHFMIKDMGAPKLIVGLKVICDEERGTTVISQGHFIDELMVRYHQETAPTALTPLSSGFEFTSDDLPLTEADKEEMTHHPYQSLVGALMYVMIGTCPNIAFAVGCLSQYLINPGRQHWDQALHVLNYLRSTWNLVISYLQNSTNGLTL